MALAPKAYRTSIATLIVVGPNFLEIHYDPHVVMNVKAVGEVQAKRRELMGKRSYATLTIIPENVDFHLDAMGADQSAPDRKENQLVATAVVAKTEMLQRLTKLYLSYFPQPQQVHVTGDEQAARMWLEQRLNEIAHQGS
jgi:predicted metal-dependent hydrolase